MRALFPQHPRSGFKDHAHSGPPQRCVSSTAHAVVPTDGPCTLNHTWSRPHWCAVPLKHTRKGSHELGILNRPWRSPHPQALCPQQHPDGFPLVGPQLDMQGSPPQYAPSPVHKESPLKGHVPSTTHGMVVLTTRLCTLKSHEGHPHSWATHSLLGTERSPLAGHGASTGHRGVPTYGQVPSNLHAVVPTCGLGALNRAEGTPVLGHWPSTGHGGVPTHGLDP